MRESFAKRAMIKSNPVIFNAFWTNEAYFTQHGNVNTQNTRIWTMSNSREYLTKLKNPAKFTVWCGFTSSFIVESFFFDETYPTYGWKICTVIAKCYCYLLRDKMACYALGRMAIPPYSVNVVKRFLMRTFDENGLIKIVYILLLPKLIWYFFRCGAIWNHLSAVYLLLHCPNSKVFTVIMFLQFILTFAYALTGIVSHLSCVVENSEGYVEICFRLQE